MPEKYDPLRFFKKDFLLNLATLCLLWGIGAPIVLGFFGVYNSSDIFSVLGVSIRRGLFAFIEETKPATVSACETRFGEKSCKTDSLKLQKGTSEQTESSQ
jgi:hypothetical protein